MFSYRHKDSVEHPLDQITLQFVFDHWARKGICIEAAYIFPDGEGGNRYEFVFEGEQDPYFRRD